MKTFIFVSAWLLCMYACTPKEKNNFSSAEDSVKLKTQVADSAKKEAALPVKIPIDTIPIAYPNGSKFHFLVYDYYDSLPGKYIKAFYDSLPDRKLIYDFEIRDAATNESIFQSVSLKLFFEEEIDHFNGDRDSLSVYPLYSVSSKNPLIVDLNFFVIGGLGYRFLGHVTYPYYEESNILYFLRYTFQLENNRLVARSSLQFTPRKCSMTEEELIAQFNKLKSEKHLDTESGDEFMNVSFACYLHGANPYYKMMNKEFVKAFGEGIPSDYHYTFIIYLDKYIVNLTFQ